MRNALILHGTNGHAQENWFPWLKTQLENQGIPTWVPDLPGADKPSCQRYNDYIFHEGWDFNSESILIGHSSGAVAILGLLQALPPTVVVDRCFLVGAFKDDLGWEALSELFVTPFNFAKIKTQARKFVLVHSDDDPYCPLDHAQYLAQQLEGSLEIIPLQKHFSVGTMGESYREFPRLLQMIL